MMVQVGGRHGVAGSRSGLNCERSLLARRILGRETRETAKLFGLVRSRVQQARTRQYPLCSSCRRHAAVTPAEP